MLLRSFFFGGIIFFMLSACNKAPVIEPQPSRFELHVSNEFTDLDAHFAVYLSDASGVIKAFRWVSGEDTAHVVVPGSLPTDRYDCTVVKVSTIEASGSGVRDTSIVLSTYTQLANGQSIKLRNEVYTRSTDLKIHFIGLTSLDSIIVADGLGFVKPQAVNDYNCWYRVLHTGRIWFRVLVNGDPHWRFLYFDNITGPTLETTVDVNLMQVIFAPPTLIHLPFSAAWQYNVDGIVDLNGDPALLALGDLIRAPGGAVPVFGQINIFEPVVNPDFLPVPKPYSSFRVKFTGTDDAATGYTYIHDKIYSSIPGSLPLPNFDLTPTVLSDNRLVAVQCSGDFTVLAFSRTRAGTPNIKWEVYTPAAKGIVTYRLPDVPAELGTQFPALKNYDFGGQVRARAELYDLLGNYDAVMSKRLSNDDYLWQAKAGYLGREENQ